MEPSWNYVRISCFSRAYLKVFKNLSVLLRIVLGSSSPGAATFWIFVRFCTGGNTWGCVGRIRGHLQKFLDVLRYLRFFRAFICWLGVMTFQFSLLKKNSLIFRPRAVTIWLLRRCHFVVCQLLPDRGPCRESHKRWYYDVRTDNCTVFIYGGCLGNQNSFDGPERCETTCRRSKNVVALPFGFTWPASAGIGLTLSGMFESNRFRMLEFPTRNL